MSEFKEVGTQEEDENIVELTDDNGRVLKFYHIATLDHKEKWYAFFQPAEKVEGVSEDEVVIFEIAGDDGEETLLPVEDEALLDEVYAKFVAEMEEDDCDCEECAEGDGVDGCSDEGCDCGCHHHKNN